VVGCKNRDEWGNCQFCHAVRLFYTGDAAIRHSGFLPESGSLACGVAERIPEVSSWLEAKHGANGVRPFSITVGNCCKKPASGLDSSLMGT